jgi:hypothetical protein
MEQILNFDVPLDVEIFDRVVACMYSGSPQEVRQIYIRYVLTQIW